MIEPAQIRAARALLDWTIEDLAQASGLNKDSIKNAERSHTQPRTTTMAAIRDALEKAGVEFLPNQGVKRRNELIVTLDGDDANQRLLDDVFKTLAGQDGGCVYIAGVKESQSISDLELENLNVHLERLEKAGISEKLLIEEGDQKIIAPKSFYRTIPSQFFDNTPIQVYGDKIAFVEWGPPKQIIIIQNKGFSRAMAKLIDLIWHSGGKV